MEVAEDVPRQTVEAEVSWEWETFAEYLDFVSRRPMSINFDVQIGHGTLRSYVLGERAYEKDAATEDEIEAMCRELDSALQAGALGFTAMLESTGALPGRLLTGTTQRGTGHA